MLGGMRISLVWFTLLTVSSNVRAEIPEWYKRDIGAHLAAAKAVILCRADSVSLESSDHHHFLYRIDTTTIEALKGTAPNGDCYLMQSESELDTSSAAGERRLVILGQEFGGECGLIEPGYSAPGTDEYLELFREVLKDAA